MATRGFSVVHSHRFRRVWQDSPYRSSHRPAGDNASMPHLYENLVQALQSHWKAHANAYPQKFVLSPEQHATLEEARQAIHRAVTGKQLEGGEPFMGVPLEVASGSAGEMVTIDGAVTSLGNYSREPASKS